MGLSNTLSKRKSIIEKTVHDLSLGKIDNQKLSSILDELEIMYPITTEQDTVIKEIADYKWKHQRKYRG